MAIVKKCDICGDTYDVYNEPKNPERTNGFMFVNIDIQGKYYANKPIDCCQTCMDHIRECIADLKASGKKLIN